MRWRRTRLGAGWRLLSRLGATPFRCAGSERSVLLDEEGPAPGHDRCLSGGSASCEWIEELAARGHENLHEVSHQLDRLLRRMSLGHSQLRDQEKAVAVAEGWLEGHEVRGPATADVRLERRPLARVGVHAGVVDAGAPATGCPKGACSSRPFAIGLAREGQSCFVEVHGHCWSGPSGDEDRRVCGS
jgi:hypothetical protein